MQKVQHSSQTFYSWKEKFVDGGKAALASTSNDNICKTLQKENETLKRIVGELIHWKVGGTFHNFPQIQ